MHFFIQSLISALLIILAAIIVPGISIIDPAAALVIALVFGALNRSLRHILAYFEIPMTAFYFSLFTIPVNGFLVAWSNLIQPGIFVRSIAIAAPFIAVLSAGNVLLLMRAQLDYKRMTSDLLKSVSARYLKMVSAILPDTKAAIKPRLRVSKWVDMMPKKQVSSATF